MNSEISKIFSKLVRENCFGCVHNCLSQRDHDVCLVDKQLAYYRKLAIEQFNGSSYDNPEKAKSAK